MNPFSNNYILTDPEYIKQIQIIKDDIKTNMVEELKLKIRSSPQYHKMYETSVSDYKKIHEKETIQIQTKAIQYYKDYYLKEFNKTKEKIESNKLYKTELTQIENEIEEIEDNTKSSIKNIKRLKTLVILFKNKIEQLKTLIHAFEEKIKDYAPSLTPNSRTSKSHSHGTRIGGNPNKKILKYIKKNKEKIVKEVTEQLQQELYSDESITKITDDLLSLGMGFYEKNYARNIERNIDYDKFKDEYKLLNDIKEKYEEIKDTYDTIFHTLNKIKNPPIIEKLPHGTIDRATDDTEGRFIQPTYRRKLGQGGIPGGEYR